MSNEEDIFALLNTKSSSLQSIMESNSEKMKQVELVVNKLKKEMEEQQVLNKDLLLESKVLKEENDEMKNQIYRHYQREAAQTLGLGSLESSLSELVELVRHVQLSTKEIQNQYVQQQNTIISLKKQLYHEQNRASKLEEENKIIKNRAKKVLEVAEQLSTSALSS
mmetsp:Transcript_2451/g.3967  ORF Transcript_2451/g.3967 Transcript_2451/m.3967 type:complete len:166 (-) Transcript_2451:69-566(-)